MTKRKKRGHGKSILYSQEEALFGWLTKNKHAVLGMLMATSVLVSLLFLPYVNLFIGRAFVSFLLIIFVLIFFNVSTKRVILLSLLLILLALPMILVNRYGTAELLGDFAYGTLFFGVIKLAVERGAD